MGSHTIASSRSRFLVPPSTRDFQRLVSGMQRSWVTWAQEQVGSLIGPYRLTKFVACGGMGTVFEATSPSGCRVALKLLSATESFGDHRRFSREIRVLSRLRHVGINRVLDSGKHQFEDGHVRLTLPFYIMELVVGSRTIRDYVLQTDMNLQEKMTLYLQVCEAVSWAHQGHVIHRDLKPDNILMNRDGQPKLIDFGLAKIEPSADDSQSLTHTGTVMGTRPYMSPEQKEGRPAGMASDVYSLGLILWEIITGARLDEPTDFERTTRAHQRWHTIDSSQRRPLEVIIKTCLSASPRLRYPSAESLVRDTRRFLSGRRILGYRQSRRGVWSWLRET